MIKEVSKCITFIFIIVFSLLAKGNGGLNLKGGMYSELGIVQTYDREKKDEVNFTGKSVLSLSFKNSNRKFGKVESDFDLILPYGSSILEYSPAFTDSLNSNILELFSFGKTPLLLDIRKFYLSIYLPFADISIGRQIINFGKGLVFSPVDAFAMVELQDINLRKTGSDIVNVKIPIGDLSGIDLIVEMPFLEKGFSSAIKTFTTVNTFDLSLLGIYKKAGDDSDIENEILGGFSFKGDLVVGLYGEGVVHYIYESNNAYFESMLGIDYSVKGKWIFALEYLYKQQEWQKSFWGENNIFGSAQFVINELANLSGSLIYNFEDNMTLGTLQFNYNILQNVNTVLYVQGIDSESGSFMKYSLRAEVKF